MPTHRPVRRSTRLVSPVGFQAGVPIAQVMMGKTVASVDAAADPTFQAPAETEASSELASGEHEQSLPYGLVTE